MIPRVIHRIWLGPNPMPEDFERYGRTWHEHHPDWEVRLWTDHNLPELRFPEALERCRNAGERSDLIRFEVLVRHGGVYVDTDVECLRSFAPLMDTPAFVGETRPGKLGSAVVGAEPGHPAFGPILEAATQRVGIGHQAASAGPRFLTEMLRGREDVTVFPRDHFYPFHHRRQPDKNAIPSDAYAIHHVEASWKDRDALRADNRRLKARLERTQETNKKLRRQRRRLRERLERSRARNRREAAQAGRAGSRLQAVERTGWWRARAALARGTRPLRSRARRRS